MADKHIQQIDVEKLLANPANPNRMSEGVFKKLLGHIKDTGNYEPIVVRVHPHTKDNFEIINGHHRLKAIMELGYKKADCVVWDVDDKQTLMLLATLNRLHGNDDFHKKSHLVSRLNSHFSTKQLSRMLTESEKAIRRLIAETQDNILPKDTISRAFLNPMVFFLTDEQAKTVNRAIAGVNSDKNVGTGSQKRAEAITKLAEIYLNEDENTKNE